MGKNITIKDIARLANVSPTAVSFYLNGKAKNFNLAESTCQKIQQVIDQYNYRPNIHARAINERKTYLVGMLINNLIGSFYAKLVWGVEKELALHGYHMVFAATDNNREKELSALKFMAQTGIDGCIITPHHTDDAFPESYDNSILRGKPIVNLLYGSAPTPVFDTDHEAGVTAIAREFLQAGHRKLAYFGQPLPELPGHFNGERYEVFNRCVLQAGGEPVDVYSQMSEMLDHFQEYSGIFCFSDSYAIQMIIQLQKLKIRVPEDISIAGYGEDDITAFFDFDLTTVRENKEELGRLAAWNLLQKIEHPEIEIPQRIRMQPLLLPGRTIGPVRSDFLRAGK
ncbi:MAG: LacI family transcriptional regulator [Lentisphaerae bacterium]|nr:LacI family transcriptional regulator [Lentisphaerota bacterium]